MLRSGTSRFPKAQPTAYGSHVGPGHYKVGPHGGYLPGGRFENASQGLKFSVKPTHRGPKDGIRWGPDVRFAHCQPPLKAINTQADEAGSLLPGALRLDKGVKWSQEERFVRGLDGLLPDPSRNLGSAVDPSLEDYRAWHKSSPLIPFDGVKEPRTAGFHPREPGPSSLLNLEDSGPKKGFGAHAASLGNRYRVSFDSNESRLVDLGMPNPRYRKVDPKSKEQCLATDPLYRPSIVESAQRWGANRLDMGHPQQRSDARLWAADWNTLRPRAALKLGPGCEPSPGQKEQTRYDFEKESFVNKNPTKNMINLDSVFHRPIHPGIARECGAEYYRLHAQGRQD